MSDLSVGGQAGAWTGAAMASLRELIALANANCAAADKGELALAKWA